MAQKDDDYPWIRKWCKHMGSFDYYVAQELERARADNAPHDAVYSRHNGTWATIADVTRPETRESLGLPPLEQDA